MRLKLAFSFVIGMTSLLNAQQLKTYTGDYRSLSVLDMVNPKATYSYYENEDYERIYNGDFSCTFQVANYSGRNLQRGSIKGQFKDGQYDGCWKLVYPYSYENKYYTAIMDVSFNNGLIHGPLKVVVTDAGQKRVCETTIEFVNGTRSGILNHYSKLNPYLISEVKGQYKNDNRSGKWTYVYEGNKGIVEYDDGVELRNFTIDNSTGSKTDGMDIPYAALDYGNISFSDLLNALGDININTENKSFDIFWEEY